MTARDRKREEIRELATKLSVETRNGFSYQVQDAAYEEWAKAVDEFNAMPCEDLHDYRIDRGLTFQELSNRTGIPVRTLQKYEAGETKLANMTLKKALALSNALALTRDQLEILIENEDNQ